VTGRPELVVHGGEQADDLGDGQRDHAGAGRECLAGLGWRRCPGIGAAAERGGGDSADGLARWYHQRTRLARDASIALVS
jgi:hypothetical protein